ncbi:MAG: lytic murein transglycosylase, partial [Solirubrobacteraceae bacterium]
QSPISGTKEITPEPATTATVTGTGTTSPGQQPGAPGSPATPQSGEAPKGDTTAGQQQSAQKTQGHNGTTNLNDVIDEIGAARGAGEKGTSPQDAQAGAGRNGDGTPTAQNPAFSLALPGAAPIGVPNFFIDKFRIPPFLLPIYQAAGIQYGVRWEVLAAINEIETDYGRNLNVSSAGAVGWMQFLPSTFKRYGVDANKDGVKDPYNPVDAIFSSARYLRAAGGDTNLRKAIFAYNHATWYVDSVMLRARVLGGLPSNFVGSLTGLTQGHFPIAARSTYADDLTEAEIASRKRTRKGNAAWLVQSQRNRRGINIYSKRKAPVIAVGDGKITQVGTSKRLGKFVQLLDAYGNTYTYGHLGAVAKLYPAAKPSTESKQQISKELELPKADAAPTGPASAGRTVGRRAAHKAAAAPSAAAALKAAPAKIKASSSKERLFANPFRARSTQAGGSQQVLQGKAPKGSFEVFRAGVSRVFGIHTKSKDVTLKPLRPGSKVVAGTILGRLGKSERTGVAPHLEFEIRPAGRGAPRIDPKPILDGWKLLESTAIYRAADKNPFSDGAAAPTIGQILLMDKESLQRLVLADPRVEIYGCGQRDIRLGQIDRRVLAAVEFLSLSGFKPTVSALECGHSFLTAGGNVSEHSSGNAVDIAKINGIPILGHQGPGSITDITIQRLLTLQGLMKPHQIISLMTFKGTDNTLSLPDHADHIHVGYQPLYGTNSKAAKQVNATLKPDQWIKLVDRLNKIDEPTVASTPSKYALEASRRASKAHVGD